MEDKYLSFAKDFAAPVMLMLAMLYFFVTKILPAQHTRDTEKENNFVKTINELTIRTDAQVKAAQEAFIAELAEGRKQDADIRAHHKEVIEQISNQAKDGLNMSNKWLESTTTNHLELRSEIKQELKDLKRVMTEGLDRLNLLLTPSPLQQREVTNTSVSIVEK